MTITTFGPRQSIMDLARAALHPMRLGDRLFLNDVDQQLFDFDHYGIDQGGDVYTLLCDLDLIGSAHRKFARAWIRRHKMSQSGQLAFALELLYHVRRRCNHRKAQKRYRLPPLDMILQMRRGREFSVIRNPRHKVEARLLEGLIRSCAHMVAELLTRGKVSEPRSVVIYLPRALGPFGYLVLQELLLTPMTTHSSHPAAPLQCNDARLIEPLRTKSEEIFTSAARHVPRPIAALPHADSLFHLRMGPSAIYSRIRNQRRQTMGFQVLSPGLFVWLINSPIANPCYLLEDVSDEYRMLDLSMLIPQEAVDKIASSVHGKNTLDSLPPIGGAAIPAAQRASTDTPAAPSTGQGAGEGQQMRDVSGTPKARSEEAHLPVATQVFSPLRIEIDPSAKVANLRYTHQCKTGMQQGDGSHIMVNGAPVGLAIEALRKLLAFWVAEKLEPQKGLNTGAPRICGREISGVFSTRNPNLAASRLNIFFREKVFEVLGLSDWAKEAVICLRAASSYSIADVFMSVFEVKQVPLTQVPDPIIKQLLGLLVQTQSPPTKKPRSKKLKTSHGH